MQLLRMRKSVDTKDALYLEEDSDGGSEMWFLQNTAKAGVRFSLLPGKDLVVGRKDCDVLIQGDKSISRKHAVLFVEKNEKLGVVYLTDCKSTFGTHVNGRKLQPSEKAQLHHNDVIKFGQGQGPANSMFKLVFEPLVLCCSGMGGADKQRVKQLAKRLGAQVVSNWTQECTHLVMTSLTVTVKVVSALASCRPIVTPSWLEEAAKNLGAGHPLPDSTPYLPSLVDSNIEGASKGMSFAPDFRRTSLFKDRTFYFLTESQYTRLSQCVQAAGATCCRSPASNPSPLESLATEESIVLAVEDEALQLLGPEEQEWVVQVTSYLTSQNLRPILDSEIGFALLHISTNSYCNPQSTEALPQASIPLPAPSLSQQEPVSLAPITLPFTQDPSSQSQANVTVYAPDTEPSLPSQAIKKESHTEETVTQANTAKIDETILHRKNSPAPIPPSTHRTADSKKAAIAKPKNEPLDSLFDFHLEDEQSFPPVEVKSKLEKKPPLTSTQADDIGAKPLDSPLKARPPTLKSHSSIIDHSKPDQQAPNTSALPGSKKRSPNMSEILAPQSVESVQDPGGSILAPSSLTPRSQDVLGGTEGKSLPDSDLISTLFKGMRKKRPNEGEREREGLTESASSPKRQRLEQERQRRGEKEEAKDTLGGGLFSGIQRTRGKRKLDTETVTSIGPAGGASETKTTAPEVMTKLAPNRDTTSELPTLQTAEEVRAKKSTNHMVPPTTPTEDSGSTHGKRSRKRKAGQSSSPFLSARKRRRSSREEACSMHDTSTSPHASPLRLRTHTQDRAPDTCTEATNTLPTVDTLKSTHAYSDLTSPFTCLAVPPGTGGKRTKVQDVDAHLSEDFWKDSDQSRRDLDTENPLGPQEPPRRIYKPVCTDEGFIRPRTKPKLQASRATRIGMMLNGDSGSRGEEYVPPTAPVEVGVVSLVVERPRRGRTGRGDGAGGEEDKDDHDGSTGQSGVKNFKKFRKVQNITAGIPRMVAVVKHVPRANKELLQDWLMETSTREDPAEPADVESSQDLFLFQPSKRGRTA